MTLRRLPVTVRHGAARPLVVGLALVVCAGVASADAAPGRPHATAQRQTVTPTVVPAVSAVPSSPAPVVVPRATVVVAAKPAPATKSVISGLAANGIPTVALNAYRVAAARMRSAEPSCGIDWALLAGIGREESDHGRFGGAVLHADGLSSPRIIGPALTGKVWDYIPAPADGMALDGDAVYAHALGPMQFIPSTWAEYGVSASGHGVPDIFNINDAALTAARYLCAAGGNLRTLAGQTRAVLAYNHNSQYLAQVLALAAAYRSGIRVTGIPVGLTSGALPPVSTAGGIPVANPGGPTAVDSGHQTASTKTTKTTSPSSAAPKPGTSGPTPAPSSGGSPSPTSGGAPAPSQSPTPSPTPTPTCKVWLGKICLVK